MALGFWPTPGQGRLPESMARRRTGPDDATPQQADAVADGHGVVGLASLDVGFWDDARDPGSITVSIAVATVEMVRYRSCEGRRDGPVADPIRAQVDEILDALIRWTKQLLIQCFSQRYNYLNYRKKFAQNARGFWIIGLREYQY